VKLWIAEMTAGTRIVIYAEDATAAAAAARAEDGPLVCGLREWPVNAAFVWPSCPRLRSTKTERGNGAKEDRRGPRSPSTC
jgi:hypothetical protein